MNLQDFRWTRPPQNWEVTQDGMWLDTQPHTDLWQRTYYHFRNDNAPVFQMETEELYFTFEVKACFQGRRRFDQCGVALYLDSENWLKASVEHGEHGAHYLGSVVTNHGYSDWATTEVGDWAQQLWYRLSRRGSDFCVEYSRDGATYHQMRICHLWEGGGPIRFGVYGCSPEESSFRAQFSQLRLLPCQWAAHDGQPPDEEV